MSAEPELVAREEQPYLAIPIQVTLADWGWANALVEEVLHWNQAHGVPVTPPPFFRYRVLGDSEKEFHLDVGWTVPEAQAGDERVKPGSIPAGRYVSMIHQGHPDRLEQTFVRMDAWVHAQGLAWDINREAQDDMWLGRFEFFLTNPAEQPDPAHWSIEVLCKVADEE